MIRNPNNNIGNYLGIYIIRPSPKKHQNPHLGNRESEARRSLRQSEISELLQQASVPKKHPNSDQLDPEPKADNSYCKPESMNPEPTRNPRGVQHA